MSVSSLTGGAWLFEAARPHEIYTPEGLSDEHRLIAKTTEEFIASEVMPGLERLEAKDWTFARALIERSGTLGLLGLAAPEDYGGLHLDEASSLMVWERIARAASFATTFGGQTNLCILPLVLFGTPEQKAHYLPRLIAGTIVGAYALSESGSGSDALAARTRADQQPDGTWLLNGEKMWISNGGFADLIIVFAKVDGERFTAFLVERSFPGVSAGKEEHKLGLHGSSTTPIVLADAHVPAGNVLGEVGRGHKVALNTLNHGRFALGAMCVGNAKWALGEAARYAASRRQFGQPIASFGAIKHKLGEMAARIYVAESLVYRTTGLIDRSLADTARDGPTVARSFEEFAIEASICKVAATEVLDYVLDENIQIHGGNGVVREYMAERSYRDARVNRIFEGTNEINRLLIPGMLIRRGLKGAVPLVEAATRLQDDILSLPSGAGDDNEPLGTEMRTVGAFKQVALMVLGTALRTYGDQIDAQQEVLACAANIMIDAYGCESATARASAVRQRGGPSLAFHDAATRLSVHEATTRVESTARAAFAAMAEGDALRTLAAALRRVLKPGTTNVVALRRQLAESIVANGRYILD